MLEILNKETFITKVFDYERVETWRYAGDIPAIIEFTAEWCPPCKLMEPILEELAHIYNGRLKVYQVDTDDEQELAQVFGVLSMPTFMFVPMGEDPKMSVGAVPKAAFFKAARDILKLEQAAVQSR